MLALALRLVVYQHAPQLATLPTYAAAARRRRLRLMRRQHVSHTTYV